MKRILIAAALLVYLSSCTQAPPPVPTATATKPPTATFTPQPTATITPEPTPTKEPLPARWDDPELLADVRADFEAATGMRVEDYYNKAVEDGLVSVGESNVSVAEPGKYGVNKLNGIGLGARAVETGDGTLHLVAYFARRSGDGVGVYPVDVAIERNGSYSQTAFGRLGDMSELNVNPNPIHFSSVEDGVKQLDRLMMGSRVSISILAAFRSLAECDEPQNPYVYNADEGYWAYAQEQCRTEGTYLNVGSQEPLKVRGGVEFSRTYNITTIMERSSPAAGLIVSSLGFIQH